MCLQAEGFHGELEEFLQWLRRTESQLSAAKPTGGLPETAREQLEQHMVPERPDNEHFREHVFKWVQKAETVSKAKMIRAKTKIRKTTAKAKIAKTSSTDAKG